MGLGLTVGLMSDILSEDPDLADEVRDEFAAIDRLLKANGLSGHSEPEDVEVWEAEMPGYSGIHFLRRFAAHVDCGLGVPAPGDNDSSDDPVLEDYYRILGGKKTQQIAAHRFQRGFSHLIFHSDAEGFYVPLDFAEVIEQTDDIEIVGEFLGSTQRLLAECKQLHKILEIPANLDTNSPEIWEPPEAPEGNGPIWPKYETEVYCCLALIEACEHSLKTGAAIAFT